MNEIGITRYCEWNKLPGACGAGWGSADSSGVKSCGDGSAKENCNNIIHIPLKNLDSSAVRRLRELGDVDES